MRRNILSDVLSADGRVSWPLPQRLSTGASQHRNDVRHNFADSGDKRKHMCFAAAFLELQRRPFNVGVCPRFVGSMPLTSKHIDGEAGSKPTALTSTPAIQARRFLLDVFEDLGPNERWKRRRG